MTSRVHCWTAVSAPSHTGCSPPFCYASPVRRGALPGKWASMSRTSYRWCWWLRNAALSYEMHRQLEGTVEADDLYHTAGQKGQAPHGGKKSLGRRARGRRKNASRAGAIMTKTGRRLSPGSAAMARSSSRRPAISPSRRCKKRPTSPSNGQSALYRLGQQLSGLRAMGMRLSITRRRNMPVGTCMRIERSAFFPYSSPICGYFGASAKPTCRAIWASFNSAQLSSADSVRAG